MCQKQSSRKRWAMKNCLSLTLESHRRADHRSVDDVVPFKSGSAGALRKIRRQGTESKVTIDGDAMDHTERPVVGGKGLPGALAAGSKPTKVAAELNVLARRQLVLPPCANEGIDPVDATGFRKRATSSYRKTAWTAYGQGCRQISRDIYVLVPPACSSQNIE